LDKVASGRAESYINVVWEETVSPWQGSSFDGFGWGTGRPAHPGPVWSLGGVGLHGRRQQHMVLWKSTAPSYPTSDIGCAVAIHRTRCCYRVVALGILLPVTYESYTVDEPRLRASTRAVHRRFEETG
jgi:hypothetical protein